MKFKVISIYLTSVFYIVSCTSENDNFNPVNDVEEVWSSEFSGIGMHSSPRTTDLNQNGTKDLVFGTGKLEMQNTTIGFVALNGSTGDTLWTLPARDQIFGSANFLDINGDGVQDVIINGRAATLLAIEGKTGNIIWEFLPDVTFEEAKEKGMFNFYNPQFIPDQNNNGLPDILIANGGDVTVPPNDPNRPPGKLMVISSKTGSLIAEAYVPDGKETYMSAVTSKLHENDEDFTVIYGTGGETIGGALYRTTLRDILNGDLSDSIELTSSENKGFIAPPVLVDLNGDGYLDIAANAFDGRSLAFSGKDNSLLWEVEIENTEVYGSFAVGNFVDKNRVDLFTSFAFGVWPDLRDNEHVLINGETGEVIMRGTLGLLQSATPVAADFNNNGYDEALWSRNMRYEDEGSIKYAHQLVIYDFHNNRPYTIVDFQPGANLSSTPWIGDLDSNGKLDIVYSILTDERDIFTMNGFKIFRFRLNSDYTKEVKWGSYMGSEYNGIYREDESHFRDLAN